MGEPFVIPTSAEDGVGDPQVVIVAERLDGALELGSRFEGDRGRAFDAAGRSRSLERCAGSLGGKEGEERLEVIVGHGARVRLWGGAPGSGLLRRTGNPIDVGLPHEPTRIQWKPALIESAWAGVTHFAPIEDWLGFVQHSTARAKGYWLERQSNVPDNMFSLLLEERSRASRAFPSGRPGRSGQATLSRAAACRQSDGPDADIRTSGPVP